MDEKSNEWYRVLEKALMTYATEIFESATVRDFKGISEDDKELNIATAYNAFRNQIYKEFHREG